MGRLIKILVIGLLGIALWQAYAPYIINKDDVEWVHGNVVYVTPDQVVDLVKKSYGKPSVVYIYASWCTTCAYVTPLLMEKIKSGQLSNMQLIFVAMEKEVYDLSHYLVSKDYARQFTPYIMKEPMGDSLKPLGGKTVLGIPYLGFYDAFGSAVYEHAGVISQDELDAVVSRVSGLALHMNVKP
ncbi:MAG: hypothetical protein SFT92_08020 [Rickettsiales bacterium]|nr:hypothetical protein [Rickettsiales bacterium]